MARPRSALWRIPTWIQTFFNWLYQNPTFLVIPSESGRKFRAYSGIPLISTVRLKSAVLSWADQDRIYRGFLYQNRTCRGFPLQSCISCTYFPTLFVYPYPETVGTTHYPILKKNNDTHTSRVDHIRMHALEHTKTHYERHQSMQV